MDSMNIAPTPAGRFAPSPSGRMHLGNVFTALMSWLSVRKAGGRWILRIEDLDPQRSKLEYAKLIEDDLDWLGLDWAEGGIADVGPSGPYRQSRRSEIYADSLRRLDATGFTYPCTCTRADIMATQAPHQSDGRIIYGGTCRPAILPSNGDGLNLPSGPYSTRLYVPDVDMRYHDKVYGPQTANLAQSCGDFVLCRADGAWAYQLAVVVDDALMGVTEVVRGNDLLLSTAQQIYLYRLLGYPTPEFAHLPLICNASGQRLSKRDKSMSMEELRKHNSPAEIIGRLAYYGGVIATPDAVSPVDLVEIFDWCRVPKVPSIIVA